MNALVSLNHFLLPYNMIYKSVIITGPISVIYSYGHPLGYTQNLNKLVNNIN